MGKISIIMFIILFTSFTYVYGKNAIDFINSPHTTYFWYDDFNDNTSISNYNIYGNCSALYVDNGALYIAGNEQKDMWLYHRIGKNLVGITLESKMKMEYCSLNIGFVKSETPNIYWRFILNRDCRGYDDSYIPDESNIPNPAQLNEWVIIKLYYVSPTVVKVWRSYDNSTIYSRDIDSSYVPLDSIAIGIQNYGKGKGWFDYIKVYRIGDTIVL